LDYRVQVRTVGPERFMDDGGCARTHLHLELRADTVDTEHVLAPAASEGDPPGAARPLQPGDGARPGTDLPDPLVPVLRGPGDGPLPRTSRYRGSDAFGWDGVYSHLPEVGALRPYARSPEHLVRQQFGRYRAWLSAMERAGVDPGLFLVSGGDLLRPAWNPVRLNRQGTLELRGLDSNLPETTLAAFELVPAAVARTREDGLTVTPEGIPPPSRSPVTGSSCLPSATPAGRSSTRRPPGGSTTLR
jgi:carboxylate-amine ligase